MSDDETPLRPVSPDDWRLLAWRAFLTAHAKVTDELARDLLAAAQMPLAWYDVLVHLAEAPEGRLRMAWSAASPTPATRAGCTQC